VVLGLLVGAAVVGLALLGAGVTGRRVSFFMREAQDVLDGPWYAGSVSILNGLLWWTAATAALVAALVLRGRRALPFFFAAALSVLLALDDLLRLHDVVYPGFGLGERYVAVGYLSAYVAYAVFSRHLSARHGRVGLLLAVVLLGVSVGADYVLQPLYGRQLLIEDSATTLGVAVWAAVQMHFALAELRPTPSTATGGPVQPATALAPGLAGDAG
jgi:hypothetical protein